MCRTVNSIYNRIYNNCFSYGLHLKCFCTPCLCIELPFVTKLFYSCPVYFLFYLKSQLCSVYITGVIKVDSLGLDVHTTVVNIPVTYMDTVHHMMLLM